MKQCRAKCDGCRPMGNLRVQCKKSSRRQGTWIRMKSGERRERCPLFPIPNHPTVVPAPTLLPTSRFPEDIQTTRTNRRARSLSANSISCFVPSHYVRLPRRFSSARVVVAIKRFLPPSSLLSEIALPPYIYQRALINGFT